MKLTIEVDEEKLQEHLNKHIQDVLVGEILRLHNNSLRQAIIDAVRSQTTERIVAAVLPTSELLKQEIRQEVRRHARKLIGQMIAESPIE